MDEFDWIERLRVLTRGDPSALDLRDDAAILPSRPGHDLVISTDSMVEGVHWLAGDDPYLVARRLLRVSLSDLAAKAAEPFGYLLNAAWPAHYDSASRSRFIEGLREDGSRFAVSLLGGDTVATIGPMMITATVFGWAPEGRAIRRSGAHEGDLCVVLGTIGDGWLGLQAARGEIEDQCGYLTDRFRLPEPLVTSRQLLRSYAAASADISDGLLADAKHIAEASGVGLIIQLDGLPLSPQALAWVEKQPMESVARLALAVGGDDYGLVCALPSNSERPFLNDAAKVGIQAAVVGAFVSGEGLNVLHGTRDIEVSSLGWRH